LNASSLLTLAADPNTKRQAIPIAEAKLHAAQLNKAKNNEEISSRRAVDVVPDS
jgi:hypothetical protein